MQHKIQIMEHLLHNDKQDRHVDMVDRPHLHMMKIAPTLPPVFSTSPPEGGFLWPPPGVVNPPLPQAVAALPYLDYHGYLPYGAPQLQYHPPTYVYLPPTDELYEGPPGERYED